MSEEGMDHLKERIAEMEELVEFLESQNEKLAEAVEDLQNEREELQLEIKSCKNALNEVIEHFDDFFYSAGLNVVHDAKKIIKDYDIDI